MRSLWKFGLYDGEMMTCDFSSNEGHMCAMYVEKWVKHSTEEEEMECHHMFSICIHIKKKKMYIYI